MATISRGPAINPACSMAQGMERSDVPIIVFHTANLEKKKQIKAKLLEIKKKYMAPYIVMMLLCFPVSGALPGM